MEHQSLDVLSLFCQLTLGVQWTTQANLISCVLSTRATILLLILQHRWWTHLLDAGTTSSSPCDNKSGRCHLTSITMEVSTICFSPRLIMRLLSLIPPVRYYRSRMAILWSFKTRGYQPSSRETPIKSWSLNIVSYTSSPQALSSHLHYKIWFAWLSRLSGRAKCHPCSFSSTRCNSDAAICKAGCLLLN